MSELENTLERLALAFTAYNIMVPKEELKCAHDEASAKKLLEENSNFDVFPIARNGNL